MASLAHYLGTHFSVCFDPGLSSRRGASGRALQGLGKQGALIGCPASWGGACRPGPRGRPREAPARVLPGPQPLAIPRSRVRDRRPGRGCTGRLGPDSLFSAQLDDLACSADALVAGHLSGRVCDDITVKGFRLACPLLRQPLRVGRHGPNGGSPGSQYSF